MDLGVERKKTAVKIKRLVVWKYSLLLRRLPGPNYRVSILYLQPSSPFWSSTLLDRMRSCVIYVPWEIHFSLPSLNFLDQKFAK